MSVGGAIGAVVGFFAGGGPIGALRGYQIGSMLDSALNPPEAVHQEGPRLTDLSAQSATYGADIPRVYGSVPIFGNVFWLENNKIKEVATTTSNGGGGGKGGGEESTTTTYAYYATFAVGLAKGPVSGIRRIWIGSKLFYDAGATDVATAVASGGVRGIMNIIKTGGSPTAVAQATASGFSFYAGTDDQLPDARMQATLGVANTPAYRGLSYLVFYDLPLKDHGNSLAGAQVKVEVMSAQTSVSTARVLSSTAPTDTASVGTSAIGGMFFSDGVVHGRGAHSVGSNYFVAQSVIGPNGIKVITRVDPIKTNPIYAYPTSFSVHRVSGYPDLSLMLVAFAGSYLAWLDPFGVEFGDRIPVGFGGTPGATSPGGGGRPLAYHKASKTLMMVGQNAASVNHFQTATVGESQWNTIISSVGRPHNWVNLWAVHNGDIYAAKATGAIYKIDTAFDVLEGPWTFDPSIIFLDRDDKYFYFHNTALANNTIIEMEFDGSNYALTTSKSVSVGSVQTSCYLGNRMWWTYAPSGSNLGSKFITFNPAPTASGVTLSSIVSAEALESSILTAGDIDVTTLASSTVRGYRIANTSPIRSGIEPLQQAFPFDVVQSGYKVKFVKRGLSSVVTVPNSDLGTVAFGAEPVPKVTNTREMDTQIPRKVTVDFMDVDREYDTGSQYDQRLNTDSVNVASISLALAMTTEEAAKVAQTLLYMYWLERQEFSAIRLPATYSHLEPCDVITIDGDAASYTLRLSTINYTSDGVVECSGKLNNPATYSSTALGVSGGAAESTIKVRGPSLYELLDLPLLLNTQNSPGFLVAMTGVLADWAGGVVYQTTDSGQTWLPLQATTGGPVIGTATATIAVHDGTTVDRASVLNVNLFASAALFSVTDAQMFNGANLFAYGAHGRWEIIAAQDCVQQGNLSWNLTNLLRGRFGTEWASGLHQANDRLVQLSSAAELPFISVPSSSIGAPRVYRGVSIGDNLSSAPDLSWTYAGVNLECLSPVYLNGNRNPSTNDWTLDWLRRTRISGEWRDWVDASLGETAESYTVEIYSSSGFTTLKRTLTSSTPTVAYTSAQQVTDFGSNQSTLYVKVYQMSDIVGPGYPLTTTITR